MEREFEPLRITPAEREAAAERVRDVAGPSRRPDLSRIPDHKPVFVGLLVGPDGAPWVVRESADGTHQIDVFGVDGRFLGTISTDVRFHMSLVRPIVRGNAVYGLTTDDFDVQYVVRLEIDGPAAVDED